MSRLSRRDDPPGRADSPRSPAIHVGVWDPERGVYQQAYGLADVANERAAGIDDHFRIGSISGTFMATVMPRLIDEGLVALDDTVAAADPDPVGTDTTDWNASCGQIGGGVHSTVADMGIWVASMRGNALLSDELTEAGAGS